MLQIFYIQVWKIYSVQLMMASELCIVLRRNSVNVNFPIENNASRKYIHDYMNVEIDLFH